MSHDDLDFEPIRGIPAELPEGERLLWQGSPDWRSLAIHAYHVRKVAIYFLVLIVWRLAATAGGPRGFVDALQVAGILAALAVVVVAMLGLLAYVSARSTVYSLTSARVLLRHGVAVPMTLNLPFGCIDAAGVKEHTDGTGDIAFTVPRSQRVGYLVTWPYVRPGHFAQPQPSLRALAAPEGVAERLRSALEAYGALARVARSSEPAVALRGSAVPASPSLAAAQAATASASLAAGQTAAAVQAMSAGTAGARLDGAARARMSSGAAAA